MSSNSTVQFSRRGFLATGLAGASVIALHPFSARAAANQAHLRIMETTDLHVHVFPYDYYSDKPRDTVGLSRTASLINQVRAEATNSLLLDNGDFLQGNPMGDYIAYERGMKEGDSHPVITAMNTVGFDASTLGNHEFNYGLDFLEKSLAGAEFPVVSANVVKEMGGSPTADKTLLKPYVILEREIELGDGSKAPIKIGVIGFVPPQIMNWDRRHLEGNVQARDIVESAQAYVPQMREEGAEIILALSHSGIAGAEPVEGMENASTAVAAVDGIDAVLTGHHHLVFPSPAYADLPAVDAEKGTLHGKPAVMGGFWGSHMGLIDLMLERDGNEWKVVNFTTEARPIAKRNEDRSYTALAEDDARMCSPPCRRSMTRRWPMSAAPSARPTRRCIPISRWWPTIPSVQIVSIAQRWYVEQMLKGTEYEGSAAALRRRALQGRWPGWPGILHRRGGGRCRDQERGRPLSLPEHRPRGEDLRGPAQGLARALRRHVQPGRARLEGRDPAQPRLPVL